MAAFIVVLMVLFINQSLIPFWQLVLISIGAAFGAPIAALFYGIFCHQQGTGLCDGKVHGHYWLVLS